jgi:hypothetical protein
VKHAIDTGPARKGIPPEKTAGRPGKTPAKVITKQPTLADTDLSGNRSQVGGRLVLFTCSECEHEVRREPVSENGAVQCWCGCGSHNFPPANFLPENPDEWAFVIKRVSRGIRDAQAECESRIKRLMVSDHVRRYRDEFAIKDGGDRHNGPSQCN